MENSNGILEDRQPSSDCEVKKDQKSLDESSDLPIYKSSDNRPLGRPKGTVKRKGGTSNLVVPLSVADKQWVMDAAQARGITMTDLITELINKERIRVEKQAAKSGKKAGDSS